MSEKDEVRDDGPDFELRNLSVSHAEGWGVITERRYKEVTNLDYCLSWYMLNGVGATTRR
jgi:hypothetical protein